ncbi:MAG: aminotransferase class I/II-fold pyridoxal phosphate-dependent enzyme [Deltaproteobacteria bacterium]|jgi:aspartate aminotransferase|nr:aminotransferase class I/II-fold pyridoxal phosphate-dependent enzyme [Deltaproteobacteria bacterium]MBW2530177.1 aminotransferase class I/II-fold pyridoxal phosphate-dependent enzyme [Deltaproteobacteria bacterium]
MKSPPLSAHFASRQPSVIRISQIEFAQRGDDTRALNVAIGNVSLPMHPAMIERLKAVTAPASPFSAGVVAYTSTVGLDEANRAFLNIIASSGFDSSQLFCQITDGGSQAMELCVVGLCGPAGSTERPLLLIDAAYTNYLAFAERLGRATVSVCRTLGDDGKFSLPEISEIEQVILDTKPGAMVVIPYDNPTGHFYDQGTLIELAKLCTRHDLWMISDEAYRELCYASDEVSSVWGVTDAAVPGIEGRRISIETASKIWNACGLRIGGLVTDSAELHDKAVAENTASLCPNAIGQYVIGALAQESHEDLRRWYADLRRYYQKMLVSFTAELRELVPGIIVSSPDASIYSVVDVRNVAKPSFDAMDFVHFCASRGAVPIDGTPTTLLTAPMAGFYRPDARGNNPGRTQMRIAYVLPPDQMALVPRLFAELYRQYEAERA